jgi:hypothetical protein
MIISVMLGTFQTYLCACPEPFTGSETSAPHGTGEDDEQYPWKKLEKTTHT